MQKSKQKFSSDLAYYRVWVLYDGNPTRVVTGKLTLMQAKGYVQQEQRMGNTTLGIACERTGRLIHF